MINAHAQTVHLKECASARILYEKICILKNEFEKLVTVGNWV